MAAPMPRCSSKSLDDDLEELLAADFKPHIGKPRRQQQRNRQLWDKAQDPHDKRVPGVFPNLIMASAFSMLFFALFFPRAFLLQDQKSENGPSLSRPLAEELSKSGNGESEPLPPFMPSEPPCP